ncbi:hypothetical protein EMA8858_01354 [Emticicia aquatica]|jgi:lysozyme family protein|uniref:TtsA-like Glycoside hydrolase family 108 domain-containing protein n=1 Tax=Emticicia aquatica TaxID=1681835 RepID=A0ABN8EQR1_9BACT|nr:glycosyl hydrolase 108 family protein [Emticicia aquatica]CAH0995234.1 hypothetical protein EMA8858_01354 [Emticicia aquatica]
MIVNKNKVLLTLLLSISIQFLQAASFEKYFPKLIKFEGIGFGIHKPIWGDKNFSKNDAFTIYKKHYWDKYHASNFTNQGVAEVLIDQLINAGEGKESVHIRAFEAIIGVKQDGFLSLADIKVANAFVFPEQIINPFVNYRLYFYTTRKNFTKNSGWSKRAKSFMITDEEGNFLANHLILPQILIKTNLQEKTNDDEFIVKK